MKNNNEAEILLIEDSDFDAELTIWALKRINLADKLVRLKDGEEALNFIFKREKYANSGKIVNPKMIILDIKMPKVDGIEVLRQLKTNEATQFIPVVIMTSSREQQDILNTYKLGVNSYIVKPVDFESFAKAVSDLGLYWLLANQAPPFQEYEKSEE